MDPVQLVREKAGKTTWVMVDIREDSPRKLVPRTTFEAWPVNRMKLEKAVTNWKDADAVALKLLDKLRKAGWKDKLSDAEQARVKARIAAREAQERAEEDARQSEIAKFPKTALDRKLAAAIAKPNHVTSLDLTGTKGNKLSMIPPTIAKLTKLKTLILDDNDLEGFPEEMEKLKALEHVSVARNKLVDMRPVCYLKNLKYFNVEDNRLVQSMAGNFQKNFEIRLAGNPIKQLGWFKGTRFLSIDTKALFPIGDRTDYDVYPAVKTIELRGRPPTDKERREAKKWFPKATLVQAPAKKP